MVVCGNWGVTPVLVGLHRVGLVGFGEALDRVRAAGLSEREAIVDFLIEALSANNYLPERQRDALRIALWREYLRYLGEDFSEFFSEVELTVHSEPGDELDRFLEMIDSVFAEFELRPVVSRATAWTEGPSPQLYAGDHLIAQGALSRKAFRAEVRKSFSDW